MNKYLVLKKNGKLDDANRYLKQNERSEFADFIKREAFSDEFPAHNSNGESVYSYIANIFGFNWENNADRGHASYGYKAQFMLDIVKEYARELMHSIGFPIYEMSGANMFDSSFPVVEAYAKLYGDRLYQISSGKKKLVMSYDGSYPQFNIAARSQLADRHLPFGHFSLADCYRYEQSGECMLLFRQRRFYMPDIHPYFKDLSEAFEWFPKMQEKILKAGQEANYDYHVVIEVSSQENWDRHKDDIIKAVQQGERDILINIIEDGKDRYWIINVDYKLLDRFNQSREIACIQIDVGNAPRLNINYVNQNGELQHPCIIHSAIPGGIERYLYLIFDDFKKRAPLWIYPAQIRLIPVGEEFIDLCEKYREEARHLPVRIEIDERDIPVSKRIKIAHNDYIPFPIVIGEQEKDVSEEYQRAIKAVVEAQKDIPFKKMRFPHRLSNRV